MFFDTFQSVFVAVIPIVLLGGVGYILVRRNVVDDRGLSMLSALLVNIFLPAMIVQQFTDNFDFNRFPYWWAFPLLGVLFCVVGFCVARLLLAIFKGVEKKNHTSALVAFQNSGYIPLLVVSSLFFGDQRDILFINILLLIVGFNVALWSWGVYLLTHGQTKGAGAHPAKKIQPPLVAVVGVMLVVYLGWDKFIPSVINTSIRFLSDCTLPVAMIVVGGNLGMTKLVHIRRKELLLALAGKLIILPTLVLAGLVYGRVDSLLGVLIMLEAAVPSAVTLSIMCRYFKVEDDVINQGLLIGHLLSIVTIPFFLALYFRMT